MTDPYEGYYSSGDTGVVPVKRTDNRLPAKDRIVGIRIRSDVKAYDFKALARDRVVNDQVGGTPLVIVFDCGSESGAVYRSDPGGTLLRFSQGKGALRMSDDGGSVWDGLTGIAPSGPRAGQSLDQVPITYSFWFWLGRLLPEHGGLRVRGLARSWAALIALALLLSAGAAGGVLGYRHVEASRAGGSSLSEVELPRLSGHGSVRLSDFRGRPW